jgi:hypothetical protein
VRVWSLSRPKRAFVVSVAALSLFLLPSAGSAEPGPQPGLPSVPDEGPPFGAADPGRDISGWLNGPINGLAGSKQAKQWTRIPLSMAATNTVFGTCVPQGGPVDGPECPFPIDDTFVQRNFLSSSAFLVSPSGSKHPYGSGPLIPVRTVAFGSIPVEVDLQVEQVRDKDDLPVPFKIDITDTQRREVGSDEQYTVLDPGTLKGKVVLRVASLSVDGVDLQVGSRCVTPPIDLLARSKEYRTQSSDGYDYNPRESAYGITGGGFNGTIDIPGFSGCGTPTGDDVGPILTSALAGSGNPVSVEYGSIFCNLEYDDAGHPKPAKPGLENPEKAGCFQFQYNPDNPLLWAIPLAWDIPDHAPGDQPNP